MADIKNFYMNNRFIINISKQDFEKIHVVINELVNRYDVIINNLLANEEIKGVFGFSKFKIDINNQRCLLKNILRDVLNFYKEELKNLKCVFLSGSYARGTNKMASDIDLHFFYKNGDYNYIYEEIICYIISKVIRKSRDCIDPTFIFNLSSKNKEIITKSMNLGLLKISLVSGKRVINYSYKYGKKRRFFLQYNNSRDINDLKSYLLEKLKKDNFEWVHCFDVIYGKDAFLEVYDQIYKEELKLIDINYIKMRVIKLVDDIKEFGSSVLDRNISVIKKHYQSYVFELVYEYISIVRLLLIYYGYEVKFINLFDIYDLIKEDERFDSEIIISFYEYMWNLRDLTVYCRCNNINYGLHNDEYINYDFSVLDSVLGKLKNNLLLELERMERML